MVFENLVGYLLDKYLGDYVENLDTKKLKVDLWSGMSEDFHYRGRIFGCFFLGNVELHNLYLKPNALVCGMLIVLVELFGFF